MCHYPPHGIAKVNKLTHSNRFLVEASATGVLGEYDHTIKIGEDDSFLIVYGPNGVGKTKFLEIIDALSQLQGFSLLALPFNSAELLYSDGSTLSVQREASSTSDATDSAQNGHLTSIEFTLQRPKTKRVKWKYDDSLASYIRRNTRYEQVSDSLWQDSYDGELVPFDELRARYEGRAKLRRKPDNVVPDDMYEFIQSVPSFLIETQRLRAEQRLLIPNRSHLQRRADLRNSDSKILSQATTIRELLNKAQTEHSRITQQLDRTFPNRVLLAAGEETNLNQDYIRIQYNKQNEFRNRLGKVASGTLEGAISLPAGSLDDWALTLLNQYLEDTEKKLKPFEGLLEKIELLEDIINSRLLNKTLQVNAEDGLLVTHSPSSRRIDLESLSSGEQHEIILMIDLLFNVPDGALVLIDEPEISLHVAWQIAFIPDVSRISELAGFRFIVATHSPQIINDQWNLAVRLGPQESPF